MILIVREAVAIAILRQGTPQVFRRACFAIAAVKEIQYPVPITICIPTLWQATVELRPAGSIGALILLIGNAIAIAVVGQRATL